MSHVEHDSELFLSVHTVAEICSPSMHISSASRVAGAIVAATNNLLVQLHQYHFVLNAIGRDAGPKIPTPVDLYSTGPSRRS